jgi:hypothetical protein
MPATYDTKTVTLEDELHELQANESALEQRTNSLALVNALGLVFGIITWTRLAIVSFAGGLPDFDPTAARLLHNQEDIGNAIKPYYGRRAGNRLTALLKEHIAGAVELLQAAKAGDDAKFATAKQAWYRNGRRIARFLSNANPRFLPFAATNRLMKGHLDQTLDEAAHRLGGDFAADIRDYDRIHRHILMMADAISTGIIKQFPGRFR